MQILVAGAGSWGTTLACLLARKGFEVTLWSRGELLAKEMARVGRNPRYVSDLEFPPGIRATSELGPELVASSKVIVLAVPSQAMRSVSVRISEAVSSECLVVSVAKGIELDTKLRMSEVLEEELPPETRDRIAVLSGPNHAEEVARDVPTATVVAARKDETAAYLQEVFKTETFRVYTNSDVVGVELGGATKNVIAIAAGISDGLGFGDNTKASLITRGLAEMTRLGTALGAKPRTFAGLAGMGDLIVTCISAHSRNRAVGQRLGRGHTLNSILKESPMVAEGVLNSKAFHLLARSHGVEVPITDNVFEVLFRDKDPRRSVKELMTREAHEEIEEVGSSPRD